MCNTKKEDDNVEELINQKEILSDKNLLVKHHCHF